MHTGDTDDPLGTPPQCVRGWSCERFSDTPLRKAGRLDSVNEGISSSKLRPVLGMIAGGKTVRCEGDDGSWRMMEKDGLDRMVVSVDG